MTRGRPPDAEAAPPAQGNRLHMTTSSPPGAEVSFMVSGRSLLRAKLDEEMAGGLSFRDLTVLDKDNDPYRIDTQARHRDGGWLGAAVTDLGLGGRPIHLRGLHYAVIGRLKPNGTAYANTDKDWQWLYHDAAKAARWLGYIDFDQIADQRNTPPVIREFKPPDPGAYLSTEIVVEIPDDISPKLCTLDFRGTQPYKLVMFGEKSSLAEVLTPLAEFYQADLYLPTGEISDTMLHRMARSGHADGRPMVVLCFSDCDPAGWQMPVSIGRKLAAFETALFPGLEFQVHRVALTPAQVSEYGLPSTPLKATELRGDRWTQAMGIEQTEIDALASLQPGLLGQLARHALGGFYDHTLTPRVEEYREEWLGRAAAVIVDYGIDRITAVRDQAREQLATMREQIAELNDQLRIDIDPDDLPPIELPEAADPGGGPLLPLVDSRWSFADQCQALIDAKHYTNGNGDAHS